MKIFGFNCSLPIDVKPKTRKKSRQSYRALRLESLENREMLSVAPLLYGFQDYYQSDWFEKINENDTVEIAQNQERVISNEWIVQLKQELLNRLYSVEKTSEYLKDYGVIVLGGLGSPGTLLVRVNANSSELQSKILAGITEIDYWEQNYTVASSTVTSVVNDPFAYRQWFLNTINVLPAWVETKGDGVVVAVLDTGVQLDHPDLQANIWTNPGEIAGNGIDDDNNGFIDDIHGWNTYSNNSDVSDTFGHGTEMAGVIGAVGNNGIGVTGVAPNAKILPVKPKLLQTCFWSYKMRCWECIEVFAKRLAVIKPVLVGVVWSLSFW